MSKTCAQSVDSLRISGGKNRVHLSTVRYSERYHTALMGVKAWVYRTVIPFIPQRFPQVKIAIPPLSEHYFYPVSTAPTINSTE
jgi:hypothetical protein